MKKKKPLISARRSSRNRSANTKWLRTSTKAIGKTSETSAFFEANLALTKDLPEFNLFDNNRAIYTRARMLPPAKVNGTTLDHAIIAEGSIIMPHVSKIPSWASAPL
jgi:hypothetical protein